MTGAANWPFGPRLAAEVRKLDDKQMAKLEGALDMWLQMYARQPASLPPKAPAHRLRLVHAPRTQETTP